MGTEFLKEFSFSRNVETLPIGNMIRQQSDKELQKRSEAADYGFWGTVWAGLKTSPMINIVSDMIKNDGDYQHSVRDALDWEDSYDWHDDAKYYDGQYPREIFIGSQSSAQSLRAMADYDDMINTQLCMKRRPIATFLGRTGAFGADLLTLRFIPFIGGLSSTAGRFATSALSNSILKGAVSGSVAFALDTAEISLARGMLDERLLFGEVVEDLPVEMLYNALIGGSFGALGGAVSEHLVPTVKEKILKQLNGGTTVPIHKFSEMEMAEQSFQLFEKLKEVSPDITPDQVSNLVQTIGGVERNSITEKSSKIMLSKLACDPTTRAYGSKVPFVREMAKKLHDSHLPMPKTDGNGGPVRSLDITVRTMQNELQGRANIILKDGYKKLTDDLNNYKISKEEFNKLVGSTLQKNGKLEGPYDPQFVHYVEETAQSFIKDVREKVQEAFINTKKLRHGKELIEKSKKATDQAKKNYEYALADQEKFGNEALEKNITDEHSKLLKSAINKKLFKYPESIERSKILKIGKIKSKFSKLREQAKGDNGGNGQSSLLKNLEVAEKKEIGKILREAEIKIKQFESFSEELRTSTTKKWKKRTAKVEESLSIAKERLQAETKILNERESGTFASDIEGWVQSNDEGYTHRMYDFPKIMANQETFVEDVTKKLIEIEGLSPSDAAQFANELHSSLLTFPVGRRFNTSVTLRGAEKHRTLQIASEVLENWIDTDAQKMAERWTESVIPDYVLQEHIGTYDANDFGKQIGKEIQELVFSGKILQTETNDLYRTSISQIQRMIDNVRGLSYVPDGAVYSAEAWKFSSATRSLVSLTSMGGLVFTSLFDIASMMLNKGIFRFLEHDGTTFLKSIFQKNFREALKNHNDLISMSGWLEAVLRKGTNRTLSDYGIPINYATRTTEFFRKAAQMQQKITGAEAIFHTLHLASDYGNLLTIARISENFLAGKVLSATESNILNIARISENECFDIANQIAKYGTIEDGVRHFNLHSWENSETVHAVKYGINALTKNSILTPGTEVPACAKTPLGEILFQYKKFIFASIDRCFLPSLGRLSTGEISILSRIFAMVAIGGLKESIFRIVAGRDTMTFQEFWAYGIGNCDALPLIGEIIKDVSIGFNSNGINGGFEHAKGWLHDYFVPAAASQSIRGLTGANAITSLIVGKRKMNTKDLRAIKSCIPYNSAFYLSWVLNRWIKSHSDEDINFMINY